MMKNTLCIRRRQYYVLPKTKLPLNFFVIRFEVAGIHPKRRPPGTLTQVSYDKKSMLPLVS